MRKSDTVYRYLGGSEENGIFACGYMVKESPAKSQLDFKIPYFSIFVLLDGSGEYTDEYGRGYPLSRGSVVRRLPGVVHSTRVHPGGDWEEFFISFGRGVFDCLLSLGLLDDCTAVSRCEITPDMLLSFEKLLNEMKTADSGGLFELLLRAQKIVAGLYSLDEKRQESPVIAEAKNLLSRELHTRVSEKDIARDLHMGYEAFRKQFKKETGLSPMEFRSEKRMMTAKILLLSGSTVKETATALGYSDNYTFSKQFKIKTGMTPGGYRKTSAR